MVQASKVASSFKVTHTLEPILSAGPVLITDYEGEQVMATRCAGSVSLRRIETGVALKSFPIFDEETEDKSISAMALSSSTLFTALSNNLIESRDKMTGVLNRSWKGHTSPVLCMTHHSSAELLATGSADHSIRVWNSTQGFCTHNLKGVHGGVVSALRFHPDPSKMELFSAGEDGSVAQWNLMDGKSKTFKSHVSAVRSIDVSPDGRFLVSGGRDQVINIWDLSSGRLLRTAPTLESIEALLFIDESKFVTSGEKGYLRLWSVGSGTCIKEGPKVTGEHGIAFLQRSTEDSLLATTTDLQILTLSVSSLELVSSMPGNLDEVTDVAFHDSGALIVATNDTSLRVFPSMESRACVSLSGHSASILSVATFGDWIVSGSRDNTVCLWKSTNGSFDLVASLPGHTDSVGAVCIGSYKDKLVFASASADMTVKVWEVLSNEDNTGYSVASRWTVKAHDKDINSLTLTPNLKHLVSGSQDKTAKIWRLEDGNLTGTLKGHRRGVWGVKCSPTEQIIATASGDQTIKIWSATTFECLKTFEGHTNSVLRVAFLPKGDELVSTGSDGLVKIWDIRSNECVRTLDEHLDRIWTLAMASNGALATGDASGIVKIWQDCSGEELALVQETQEKQLLMEQDLANMLVRKDFKNAIVMALELEQPFRIFKLMNELTKGNSTAEAIQKVSALLESLPTDKLDRILLYIRDWNTSFKRSALAQVILSVLLRSQAKTLPEEQLPSLKECSKALLPYTERHFEHIQELISNSYLVDFVLGHMDDYIVQD